MITPPLPLLARNRAATRPGLDLIARQRRAARPLRDPDLPADPLAAAPDAYLRAKRLIKDIEPHYPAARLSVGAVGRLIDAIADGFVTTGLAHTAQAAPSPTEATPPPTLPLADMADRPAAPVTILRASAGAGKSRRAIAALARQARRLQGKTVYYLTPTHALAAELADHARRAFAGALAVSHIKGRTYRDPARPAHDPTPCRKAEVILEAMRSGVRNIHASFCAAKDPESGTWRDCPLKPDCLRDGYLSQLEGAGPGLYFLTHQALVQDAPRRIPDPDLLIVDEDCLDVVMTVGRTARDRIRDKAADRELAETVTAALIAGETEKSVLTRFPETRIAGELEHHQGLAAAHARPIFPDESEETQRAKLAALRADDHRRIAGFWRVALAERQSPLPHIQRLRARLDETTGDGLRAVIHRHGRRALPERLAAVPTLILDASADLALYRAIWPKAELVDARCERTATVIGVYDTTNSRHRLLAGPTAARNRDRTLLILKRLARLHPHLAVFSYKGLIDQLAAADLPKTVDTGHFGALRGLDRFREHEAAVVIGRQELGIEAAEAYARCLFGDREPLAFAAPDEKGRRYLDRVERGYRLADGRQLGTAVPVHPCPLTQRLVERTREREIEQAVDRLRLIHRRTPATIYLLTNIPVDIAYDALLPESAFLPSKLELALASLHRSEGLLDLSTARLPLQRPDLWPSASAVKRDRHIGPSALMNDLIRRRGLILMRFRIQGRGGEKPSLAVIDPLYAGDPVAALERHARRVYDANLLLCERIADAGDPAVDPDIRPGADVSTDGADRRAAAAERLALVTEDLAEIRWDPLLALIRGSVPSRDSPDLSWAAPAGWDTS